MNASVIETIVDQFEENAAFLWSLRDRATTEPHYGAPELAKLDDRVEAHVDGLRIAISEGWEWHGLCQGQDDPGRIFTFALLSFERDELGWLESIVDDECGSSIRAIVSALGWLPPGRAQAIARRLLLHERPILQGIGLSAAAVHRWHPGPVLSDLLNSDDASLRTRALRSVGEIGDMHLRQHLMLGLRDPDGGAALAAAWSGTLMGLPACAEVLQSASVPDSPHGLVAAGLALRRMNQDTALSWHGELVKQGRELRFAISTAGIIGDSSLVPWLISQMDHPASARLAGEAFTLMTGADLGYRDLDRKPPADGDAGPTDDPADHNVEMDPDENLPWPEPALVQQWWDANRSRFQNGTRYLLGNPITDDWLKIVLRDGRQRQRAAAALELALRNPGQPLFNVKAPGFRQQQLLGKGEVIR